MFYSIVDMNETLLASLPRLQTQLTYAGHRSNADTSSSSSNNTVPIDNMHLFPERSGY